MNGNMFPAYQFQGGVDEHGEYQQVFQLDFKVQIYCEGSHLIYGLWIENDVVLLDGQPYVVIEEIFTNEDGDTGSFSDDASLNAFDEEGLEQDSSLSTSEGCDSIKDLSTSSDEGEGMCAD